MIESKTINRLFSSTKTHEETTKKDKSNLFSIRAASCGFVEKGSSRPLNERGAQLVELAIVLPIFLLLLAATAEFGNYFYTYVTLTRATRVAARHLSARAYTDAEKTVAKNLAVCGSTSSCSSGSAILTELTTSNVQITNTGNNTLPTTVTVQIVNYTYTPVFDLSRFVGGAAWSNVAAAPSTTMRYMLWR